MSDEFGIIRNDDIIIDFSKDKETFDNSDSEFKNGSSEELVDVSDLDIVDVKVSPDTSIIFKNNVTLSDAFISARIEYEKVMNIFYEIEQFFKNTSVYSCNYCLKIRKLTVEARERLKLLRKKLLVFDKELRKENKGKRGRKQIRK